ncbi:MAG: GcrA cell cycle regulator [Hyphomicrobiales bacterium]|nr:GcrA cell cycle regulator [Hyphomicrobiales bacterium]
MAWTDERVEILKKLWAEGLSASQIANRLGGVTRNAVIGKVHRLGLSGRATTSRAKAPRPRRRMHPKTGGSQGAVRLHTHGAVALKPIFEEEPDAEPELIPATVEELVIPMAERATILTLKENMCRWPIGDPGDSDFHFCGRPSPVGMPYCEHHACVAYQPVQSRRRVKAASGR